MSQSVPMPYFKTVMGAVGNQINGLEQQIQSLQSQSPVQVEAQI
jgi:hypothetical protein